MVTSVDREPSARELRWFGLLFLGFWTLIGALVVRAGGDTAGVVVVAAALVSTVLYYAVPPLRRPLLRGWLVATYPIGWAGSHLALGVVYFVVLTPLGLVMRILGRDALGRRATRAGDGGWSEPRGPYDPMRYWNQY